MRWYPSFGLNGRTVRGHRVSYVLAHGEIPEGMHIMHACDNPPCVNPAHLSAGTAKDNIHDRIRKGRTVMARGERRGASVLKNRDIVTIRSLLAFGVSQRQVAKMFGVHNTTIHGIDHNKYWSHIP